MHSKYKNICSLTIAKCIKLSGILLFVDQGDGYPKEFDYSTGKSASPKFIFLKIVLLKITLSGYHSCVYLSDDRAFLGL